MTDQQHVPSGKQHRRRRIEVHPNPPPEAKAIVLSVVDPTKQWQAVGGGLEIHVDPTTNLIHFRIEGEERPCMSCIRGILENTLRMVPKKIR